MERQRKALIILEIRYLSNPGEMFSKSRHGEQIYDIQQFNKTGNKARLEMTFAKSKVELLNNYMIS